MTPGQRQRTVVELLEIEGAATYRDLSKRLHVSSMTVRRDVDKLVTQGSLIKTLGGVQLATAPSDFYESQLASRLSVHTREKRAIARAALEEITSGDTVFIDGGTTCIELARCLAKHRKQVTVVTNSLLICREMGRTNDNTVVVMGGQYDPATFCCVGQTAEGQVAQYFAEKAFFSTKGFVASEGTYESSLALFRIKRIVASQSPKVVLLVDHSKFGQRALCKVLDVSQINMVITDSCVEPLHLSVLEKGGCPAVVAPVMSATLEVVTDAT